METIQKGLEGYHIIVIVLSRSISKKTGKLFYVSVYDSISNYHFDGLLHIT